MTQTKLYNLKNAYGNLEETLDKERQDHEKEIDELRTRCKYFFLPVIIIYFSYKIFIHFKN